MSRVELGFVGLRISLVSLLLLVKTFLCGQIKWDGGAGDGQWSSPLNWAGDLLPTAGDDVVLDNSFLVGSYRVTLPPGNVTTSVRSLQILPTVPDSIYLELPKTNTISPGLTITGSSYPLVIGDRGVLLNGSGSSSGTALVITDSVKILNGGTYIHRTPRAHATFVSLLSRSPGTEKGVFWFDVPDVSSTISLSDRTFGELVLMATAAGGSLNYTAASTRKIRVRSDLIIGAGVKLNLNCSDTFHVQGSLVQEGGTLNLSSNTRLLVMAVEQNLTAATGSVITETGTSSAVLLLNGVIQQRISIQGSITNQVVFRQSNAMGAVLDYPLSIGYQFDLLKGRLQTSNSTLLTILATGVLKSDSLRTNCFIDGPLKMQGLLNVPNRLFPVGASNELRWIALRNASGDFTVQYHRSNPRAVDSRMVSIDHISANEYWTITTTSAVDEAAVEISINDGNQSGVTDMSSLRVSRLSAGGWADAGSQLVTGSAGGRGSVVSILQNGFSTSYPELFTLAGSNSFENPLPLSIAAISVVHQPKAALVNVVIPASCVEYSIEKLNGAEFLTQFTNRVSSQEDRRPVEHLLLRTDRIEVYRVRLLLSDGSVVYSRQFAVPAIAAKDSIIISCKLGHEIELVLAIPERMRITVALYTMDGRLLELRKLQLERGRQSVRFSNKYLPSGPIIFAVRTPNTTESRIVTRPPR